jgi:5-methylcytosine-specific restriction endonuclease McrA
VTCGKEKDLIDFYTQEKYSKVRGNYTYYFPECKECTIERFHDYRENNLEKVKQLDREGLKRRYHGRPEVKKRIKDHSNVQREIGDLAEWQRNNPDKLKQYAIKHGTHSISKKEWKSCKSYFGNKCAYCGLDIEDHYIKFRKEMRLGDFHKEHVNPSGANDLSNCIPICKSCNSSKHHASFNEWYNEDNEKYSAERQDKIIKWVTEGYKEYIE